MKKILLSAILLFAVTAIYSQSQRLVILEEFTQASCGPCASVNPTIEALLNSNPTKITSVWYHTNWPGYDPMNLHNPNEVAARVGYYGVTYVPWSVLDGNYYSGSATGWNINTVNARYAVPFISLLATVTGLMSMWPRPARGTLGLAFQSVVNSPEGLVTKLLIELKNTVLYLFSEPG